MLGSVSVFHLRDVQWRKLVVTLDSLRQNVTERQREILSAIWRNYREHRQWPNTRIIHAKLGDKASVQPELKRLGGSVVIEREEPSQSLQLYHLMLLGILLTDEGEFWEMQLAEYLRYVVSVCAEDPNRKQVSSTEVVQALQLKPDEVMILGDLVGLNQFSHGSSSLGTASWEAGIPLNVEDLPTDLLGLRGYVQMHALAHYDPGLPITESERRTYYASRDSHPSMSEFAFIAYEELREQLDLDWQEAKKAYNVQAWKACGVLCGGILEGALLGVLEANEVEISSLLNLSLAQLVTKAEASGILSKGSIHLGKALAEFRNLIHPGRQIRLAVRIGEEQAAIALNTVKSCKGELQRFVAVKHQA
jgi:hypothetical protein